MSAYKILVNLKLVYMDTNRDIPNPQPLDVPPTSHFIYLPMLSRQILPVSISMDLRSFLSSGPASWSFLTPLWHQTCHFLISVARGEDGIMMSSVRGFAVTAVLHESRTVPNVLGDNYNPNDDNKSLVDFYLFVHQGPSF